MSKKALVVVLGELARSPRMQYHCMSLSNNNYQVSVIATYGKQVRDKSHEELESNQNIKQHLMPDCPEFKKYFPTFLAYILKPLWQSFLLIYYLLIVSIYQFIPNVIIIQNPPTIPTLPIVALYSKITGSKLIIDWHNYGYTILNLSLSSNHPFFKISKSIETVFGRLADAGFCVSEAMRMDLLHTFQITYPTFVLYDKPPKHFKPLSLREKHNFYYKLKKQIPEFKEPLEEVYDSSDIERQETRFTMADVIDKNVIMPRSHRPAIIFSSTSWTEDEDFDILLEALQRYDTTVVSQLRQSDIEGSENKILPSLVCVITGKGPLKSMYQSKIEKCKFDHVEIVLPWLNAEDYPKMVGSSDLGISLHSSSSGVDLPMKVVDMFGCGIPVLAYNYQAINELVIENFYGQTFNNSYDLFTKIALLLKDFHSEKSNSRDGVEATALGCYRKNIKRRFLLSRWEDNWNRVAKPVFDKLYTVSMH